MEPKMKQEEADLTGTASTLMTYRAIATDAYLVQAFSDPLDAAFGLGRRLRELADRWEDVSEEVLKILDRVKQFAAGFVGQANYSSEVGRMWRGLLNISLCVLFCFVFIVSHSTK